MVAPSVYDSSSGTFFLPRSFATRAPCPTPHCPSLSALVRVEDTGRLLAFETDGCLSGISVGTSKLESCNSGFQLVGGATPPPPQAAWVPTAGICRRSGAVSESYQTASCRLVCDLKGDQIGQLVPLNVDSARTSRNNSCPAIRCPYYHTTTTTRHRLLKQRVVVANCSPHGEGRLGPCQGRLDPEQQ